MSTELPPPTVVDLDGVPVATSVLDSTGPSRGDVVLCHGTPWSAPAFAPVAALLRRTHRVLLWDMPGYGASIPAAGAPAVDAPLDLAAQGRRLAALVRHWGLDAPHVVAHDVGGAIALAAHLDEGTRYASLFLLDAVVLHPWGSPFFGLVAQHPAVFAALPPDLHAGLVERYVAGAAHRPLDPADLARLAAPWCGDAGQAAFVRQIAALHADDTRSLAERLGRVRCPVRIGWGRHDPWLPREQASRLAALLPGVPEVHEFPDAGHLVPLEAPGALADALRGWWSEPATVGTIRPSGPGAGPERRATVE